MEKQFEIKILKLNWLENLEEVYDRCAHGKLYVRIGSKIICDENSGEWTLSSTALYLMRTVNRDYEIGDFGGQLIPCCGHWMISDENDDEKVVVLGCPNGIDWKIRHIQDNQIKHITESGEEGLITKNEYRKLALDFSNQIEKFYQESEPKKIPEDKENKKGYEAFWREWKKLKRELENES